VLKSLLKDPKKAQEHFWCVFIVNLTKNICLGTFGEFGGLWGTFWGLLGTFGDCIGLSWSLKKKI